MHRERGASDGMNTVASRDCAADGVSERVIETRIQEKTLVLKVARCAAHPSLVHLSLGEDSHYATPTMITLDTDQAMHLSKLLHDAARPLPETADEAAARSGCLR